MKVYGLTRNELQASMNTANEVFDGNLTWNREPEPLNKKGLAHSLTIRVHDSSGPGAKTGPSGRRTVSATYWAHYAFMLAIFEVNPSAKIVTAMETYNGFDEFKDKAGEVAYHNAGSIMYPIAYGSM